MSDWYCTRMVISLNIIGTAGMSRVIRIWNMMIVWHWVGVEILFSTSIRVCCFLDELWLSAMAMALIPYKKNKGMKCSFAKEKTTRPDEYYKNYFTVNFLHIYIQWIRRIQKTIQVSWKHVLYNKITDGENAMQQKMVLNLTFLPFIIMLLIIRSMQLIMHYLCSIFQHLTRFFFIVFIIFRGIIAIGKRKSKTFTY